MRGTEVMRWKIAPATYSVQVIQGLSSKSGYAIPDLLSDP